MSTERHACAWIVAGLLVALGGTAATAASANELYAARTFVTGQVEPGRSRALARCLRDVLVKVSGDPDLVRHPQLSGIAGDAASLVADFAYRDLMAGIPVHDEQGTRDRPYELTARFDPGKVDAILRALGREPWLSARPRVVVFLVVRHVATTFTLAGDETHGPGMRDALLDAAAGVGLPIVIPSRAAMAGAGFTVSTFHKTSPGALAAAAKAAGGDVALLGRLTWNDKAMGWVADWRMAARARARHWQVRGVNFDVAFRSGMRGAVRILANAARRE